MSGYRVSVYVRGSDEPAMTFDTSALPYPGLVLVHGGSAWKVERVQLLMADPESLAARRGEPGLVDVVASLTRGIHVDILPRLEVGDSNSSYPTRRRSR